MQNKPKVKDAQINVNSIITMRYEKMNIWLFGKNKANQTQFKPNQSQFKPILRPIKAKTNPISPTPKGVKTEVRFTKCPNLYKCLFDKLI
jgi:hypothetical protein